MDSNRNSKRIEVFSLLKYILKRWKVIVASVLIFTLAGVAVFFVVDRFFNKTEEMTLQEIEATLTGEEKQQAIAASKVTLSYQEKYSLQKDYNEKSIYQNLDAFNLYTATLEYYVNNYYQVSYPVIDSSNNLVSLVQAYVSLLNEDALYEKVSKAVDESVSAVYFSELVSVEDDKENGVFTVTIIDGTKEELEKIADVIVSTLNDKSVEIENNCGKHDLLLTSKTFEKTVDSELHENQQKNLESLTQTMAAIKQIENSLTGNQLLYFQKLVHEQVETSVNPMKYLVAGALLGLILSCGYIAVKYVLGDTVLEKSEIKNNCSISYVGDLSAVNESNNELLETKINLLLKANNCKNVCFVINPNLDDSVKKVVEKIQLEFPKTVVTSILVDALSLETLSKSDVGILVEKVDASKLSIVEEEIKLCDECNIALLGYIIAT